GWQHPATLACRHSSPAGSSSLASRDSTRTCAAESPRKARRERSDDAAWDKDALLRPREPRGASGRGPGRAVLALDDGREDRRDRREQLGAEHAVPGWLPDPVPGRPQPVHGFEPARWAGLARYLGRPAREQERALGCPGEPWRSEE